MTVKKRKPRKKGPHVVRLHVKGKKVPALMPGKYLDLLGEPIRKVEVVAPLEETGWQKFLKILYS